MIALRRAAFVCSLLLPMLVACGGGGATIGSSGGPIQTSPAGGSAAPTSPASGTPSHGPTATPSASASATASTSASAAPSGSATASATPTTSGQSLPPPTAAPDAAGHTNSVPALPSAGQCRTGNVYDIYITPKTGDTVAFTVFEPAMLCGGQTYPLVLHSHGFGGQRQSSLNSPTNAAAASLSPGNVNQLVAANYGVISLDERGFGQTTGTDRVMDPDAEGVDDIAIMDWAQVKLGWIAYGATADNKYPHEPIVGSIGGSYGGMYQLMLLDIDPRHRLHAIVPQIAPSDLNFSLFQDMAIKFGWDVTLFGIGTSGGAGLQAGKFDPFVTNSFASDFATNSEDSGLHDFFGYHSNSYFCNGAAIASNGGPGTMPMHAPTQPPLINAMVFIGIRDTLFNFSNGYNNYACLQKSGGDVRLLSYQFGHNTLNLIPDPGLAFLPPNDNMNHSCGNADVDNATLAFFNQYLKMQGGAAAAIPRQPCISIAANDAVLAPILPTGHAGTQIPIPSTTVVTAQTDVPTVVNLGITGPAGGTILAGLPRLEVNVAAIGAGSPIVYVGLGQTHNATAPGVWDLIDNQVSPIRGTGNFSIDMSGIGARLQPGDQLALLVYGTQDQYLATSSVNAPSPAVDVVTLAGNLWVPIIGPQPAFTTTI